MYAKLPLSPRKLGTSLRVRGKLTLRKKEFIFLKCITWLLPLNDKIQIESCPRLSGKVSAELTKGASVSRHVKWFGPVYASLPLSPRKARHFPAKGKRTTKEERIHSFYMSKNKKHRNDSHKKSRPRTRGRCQRSWRKGQGGSETDHIKKPLLLIL